MLKDNEGVEIRGERVAIAINEHFCAIIDSLNTLK